MSSIISTEPTPAQIIAAIEAEGLVWAAVGDWEGRCRCHTGRHVDGGPKVRAWTGTPIGFTVHITTGLRYTGADAIRYANNILVGGNGEVPGPLSQFGIDGDGRVLLVSAGRSNHVGKIGDDNVGMDALDMIRDGQMSLTRSYDSRGQGADADGNTILTGVEILSPSGPSAVQREAAVKLAAAMCRLYGFGARSVHGHGEIASSRGYSDPGMDMGAFRRDVLACLAPKASGQSSAPQAPGGDIIMAITQAQQADFNALLKAALNDRDIQIKIGEASLGNRYGDVTGDGKPDTAGEIIRHDALVDRVTQDRVNQLLNRMDAVLDQVVTK